jgi:hypothetical protein
MNIKLQALDGVEETEEDDFSEVQYEEEETEEDVEEEDADEDDEEQLSSGRPGIDKVLRDVEERLGPQAAEVIRGLQGDFTRSGQLQSKLEDAISEVEELRNDIVEASEGGDEAEVADPLAEVPPEQLERLQAYMERNGYIKKADIDAEQAMANSLESNLRGVETWGDSFGAVDERTGDFEPSAESKDAMKEVFQRIDSGNGDGALEFEDLFKIAYFDQIVDQAIEHGKEEGKRTKSSNNRNRVNRVVGGTVANRNAAPQTSKNVYDPDKTKGVALAKRIGDVMLSARQALDSS